MRTARGTSIVALLATGLLAAALLPGCVERKLVIRSDPPGAIVLLEDEVQQGRTPLTVPAEWDGTRRVTLQAPGYRVLDTTAEVESRWYDYFPLDVFAQFLWPGTIREDVVRDFHLEPYQSEEQHFSEAQLADMRARMTELTARGEAYRAGDSTGPGKAAPGAESGPAQDAPPPPPPPASGR